MICPKCFYCVNHAQDPNIIICTQCGTTLLDEPDDILLHGKYGITTETRPSQAKLSNEINELMIRSNDALLFAEGGTGIGKSFAYLIPAIIKNERVVISTAKKSLQRQLVDKDIPYLLGKMGITRSYGLFKGTANYACVKLEKGIKDPEERQKFHTWIQECVKNKVPADKSNWPGTEPIWWSDISAENCLKGSNCSYYAHCRPHPQNIQILVVNHSILAIDFFLGLTTKHLLGKYQTVVIDEAHQAIEMFRSALSLKLTDQMIHSAIRRFKKDEGLHKAVD